MKVTFLFNFDSELEEREIKKIFKAIMKKNELTGFELVDHYDLKSPLKALTRNLWNITRWQIPIPIKLIMYAIWVPLTPILFLIFSAQAMASGNEILEEAKRNPRYSIQGDDPMKVEVLLVGLREFLGLTKGKSELSLIDSSPEEWETEDNGEEPKYYTKSVNRDEFTKSAIQDIEENKYVRYRIQ